MATEGSKARDLVMLAVLALLVILAFIPEKKRTDEDGSPLGDNDPRAGAGGDLDQADLISRARKAVQETNRYYEIEKRLNSPEFSGTEGKRQKIADKISAAEGVPHLFLPLAPGSQWTYNVSGNPELIGQKTRWSIKVIEPPAENRPAILKAGFDNSFSLIHVQLKKGAITVDSLPFLEPLDYLMNKPTKIAGEFLPVAERIIEGSVWRNEYRREVMYDYYDDKGRIKRVQADALEIERAQAGAMEQLLCPAGLFDTRRVEWVSRLSLKVSGRQILAPLTTEPYRSETMWIAAGYGIIRRKVVYAGPEKKEAIFELVDYSRPEK